MLTHLYRFASIFIFIEEVFLIAEADASGVGGTLRVGYALAETSTRILWHNQWVALTPVVIEATAAHALLRLIYVTDCISSALLCPFARFSGRD